MEENQKGTGSIRLLRAYLQDQFKSPCGHVTFWFYFVMAIIGFGGLGIWVEIVKTFQPERGVDGLITAIYTYFPAVAAAAAFQIDLEEGKKNYVRAFALTALIVIFAPAFLHAAGVIANHFWSLAIGVLFTLMALALWWVANGRNLSFHDDIDPDDSLGLDPSAAISGGASPIKV